MGMYTELVLSCNIKNVPEVVKILKYMCDGKEHPVKLPKHLLFNSGRWEYMFQCSSHYHVPRSHASIEYDDIAKKYTLIVRSDFKNYYDEISKFVDWIAPYVEGHGDEKQMIGYSRYEEDVEPEILYVQTTEEE